MPKKQISLILCFLLFLNLLAIYISMPVFADNSSVLLEENFENATIGEIPNGWKKHQAAHQWYVTEDGDNKVYYSDNKVLAVSYLDDDSYDSLINYKIEGLIKVDVWNPGSTNQRMGFVARYVDKDNYYWMHYDHKDQTIKIQKRQNATPKLLGKTSVQFNIGLGEYHAYGFEVKGNTLRAYFNDELVLELTDTNDPIESGKPGLYSFQQPAYFDNVKITTDTEPVVIVDFEALDDITIATGKDPDSIDLPSVVNAICKDNSVIQAAVEWNLTNLKTDTVGQYVLEGIVEGTALKAYITIIVESPIVTEVLIYGADRLSISDSGTKTYSYTALVKNQFGDSMIEEAVTWSLFDAPEGVSISETGLLTVSGSITTGTFRIRATSQKDPSIFEELEVSIISEISGIKWNPGHYILMTAEYSPKSFDIIFDTVFKGAQVRYEWRDLEPTEGNYDFSRIDRDLEYLKQHGKRLVIFVMERVFGSNRAFLPDYILQEEKYGGGYEPFAGKAGGIARHWDPDVNDRFKALLAALAERYDNDPYVEAITLPETAADIDRVNAPGYSNRAFDSVLKENVRYANSIFKHTLVYQFSNYTPGDMGEFVDSLYNSGSGLGGPDTDPRGGIPAYVYFNQYKGLMPLGNSVQASSMNGQRGVFTPQQLFEMGVDNLHLNHFFWFRYDGDGTWPLTFTKDVLPYVDDVEKGRINTAIPENIKTGTKPVMIPKPSDVKLIVDGAEIDVAIATHVYRTMIPLQPVVEAIGANIHYEDKTVQIQKDNIVVDLEINDIFYKINNTNDGVLDAPPVIYNGQVMVPYNFFADSFGYLAVENKDAKTVTITSGQSDEEPAPTPDPQPQEGLVGFWKFDEMRGPVAYDYSGNWYNGTVNNAAWTEEGKVNGALEFSGNDGVFVSLPNIINPSTTDFTAMAWIKLDKYKGNSQTILAQLGPSGRPWLYVKSADNKLYTFLGNQNTGSIDKIETGVWYHVALTYSKESSTVQLYINGVLNATNNTVVAESESGGMQIGMHKSPSANNEEFDGIIDEVRIYNRALSAEEIAGIIAESAESVIKSIYFDKATYELLAGQTYQTVVTAVYEDDSLIDVTGLAVYVSENPDVAVVNDAGLITAVGNGETVVKAVYEEKEAIAVVKVVLPPSNIVRVKPLDDIVVAFGTNLESINLPSQVNVEYSDGSTASVDVQWEKDGIITDLPGTYTVEGSIAGTDIKATIRVKVEMPFVISNPVIDRTSGGISVQVGVRPNSGTNGGNAVVIFKLKNGNTPVSIAAIHDTIEQEKTYTAQFPGYSGDTYSVDVYVWDRLSNTVDSIGVDLAVPVEIE